MTVDYDLVIIGGGPAGRYAAVAATQLKARVALVELPQPEVDWAVFNQALVELGRAVHQSQAVKQFGAYPATALGQGTSIELNQAAQWIETVVSTLSEQHSPTVLAGMGIEVILGQGQFDSRPHLGFTVNGRQLQARAYIIATGIRYAQPDIVGLQPSQYLTPNNLIQKHWSQWPEELVVVGGGPVSIELSQAFTRLGSRVTLIASSSHILSQEDPDAAFWVQAQLEAEGVRVLTQTHITQVKQVNGKTLILAGEHTIPASDLLLTVVQQPNVNLNLEAVGVECGQRGIRVNSKLQTSNPRIYACGEVIGGYPFAHIANYEAQVAVKNALFWPISNVSYQAIPWTVFSDPELARVGLTEVQAKRHYGQEIRVLQQFYKTMERPQLGNQITGFCKVITRRNGTILGAHLVGPAAGDVIHAIALAMKHRLKVKAWSDLVHSSPTFAKINRQAAWQSSSQQSARQELFETFFNLCRAWTS